MANDLMKAEKEYAALRTWYVDQYDKIVNRLKKQGKIPSDLNWSSEDYPELSALDKEVKKRFQVLKKKYNIS